MLQASESSVAPELRGAPTSDAFRFAAEPFNWFRLGRHLRLVILSVVICLGLGLAYLHVRAELYTANARLLIDHQIIQFVREDTMFASSGVEAPLLHNQVAILESEILARKVIANLDLLAEEQFQPGPPGVLEETSAALIAFLASALTAVLDEWGTQATALLPILAVAETGQSREGGNKSDSYTEDAGEDVTRDIDWALDTFQRHLQVDTARRDHTLEIRFTSPDPALAARVTNELMRVYLEDQAEENQRAAQAASSWLRGRIAELGTTSRVLNEANPPRKPAGLGGVVVVSASVAFGLMFGLAAAFAREVTNRRIRTPREAAAAAGTGYLGTLPLVSRRSRRKRLVAGDAAKNGQRTLPTQLAAFSWALDRPLSQFAHTIRRIVVATDAAAPAGSKMTALGVTSVLPHEGRTVVAANIARVAAVGGKRVLLVDAVPYNRGLSRGFGTEVGPGLQEVLDGSANLEDAVWLDPLTGMHLLAASDNSAQNASTLQTWSTAMDSFLGAAAKSYDCILFDLPPLTPVADVAAAARVLDCFALVLEWERLAPDLVPKALATAGLGEEKLLGVALNKARMSRWQAFIDRDVSPAAMFGRYVNDRPLGRK